jgi:TatD DNase family protein
MLLDSHNHLQDPRLSGALPTLLQEAKEAGVTWSVVNGTCETDWPRVRELTHLYPGLLPAFGLHPWFVEHRSEHWRESLVQQLDQGTVCVGEIGLDRWMRNPDAAAQEEVFLWQWEEAVKRGLAITVHCIKDWSRLLELLRRAPRAPRGFLLHSYGGSAEYVQPFLALGAYFSLSGYFAHPRKRRQQEVFRTIPIDRLLLETDAPDMAPPAELCVRGLLDAATGQLLNHPANLASVYRFAAGLWCIPEVDLSSQVGANFHRLFGVTIGPEGIS